MKIGTYLLRAVKYFIWLVILIALIFVLMNITGYSQVGYDQLNILYTTTQGRLVILLVVGLSLVHPLIGFTKRSIPRVKTADLILFMQNMGYRLEQKEGKVMTFRSRRKVESLLSRFDNKLVIDNSGDRTVIEGARKRAVIVAYRLESLNTGREE